MLKDPFIYIYIIIKNGGETGGRLRDLLYNVAFEVKVGDLNGDQTTHTTAGETSLVVASCFRM